MKTPYQILDVVIDANDLQIKQAYLQKVKQCPPDQDQNRFQQIHNAFTSIKDVKSRMNYALFTMPVANFDELLDDALKTKQVSELTPELFDHLLTASIDEQSFLHLIDSSEKP